MAEPDLAGRVVLITGASRGIGRGIAVHLARQGVRLAVTGRKQERLDHLHAELSSIGEEPIARIVDVADREATLAFVEDTQSRFGRIDGLVANAQTFRPVMALDTVRESDMDLLLDNRWRTGHLPPTRYGPPRSRQPSPTSR
jgi:NAD(P)-dependent dehydrogenase (short-subunit alcohol dehydrogenase family)